MLFQSSETFSLPVTHYWARPAGSWCICWWARSWRRGRGRRGTRRGRARTPSRTRSWRGRASSSAATTAAPPAPCAGWAGSSGAWAPATPGPRTCGWSGGRSCACAAPPSLLFVTTLTHANKCGLICGQGNICPLTLGFLWFVVCHEYFNVCG